MFRGQSSLGTEQAEARFFGAYRAAAFLCLTAVLTAIPYSPRSLTRKLFPYQGTCKLTGPLPPTKSSTRLFPPFEGPFTAHANTADIPASEEHPFRH